MHREKDILLTDTKDKKLSNYAVEDLMAASIKSKAKQLGDATYEVFTYYGKSDGEFTISIDLGHTSCMGVLMTPLQVM